uniref:Zinc finger protein 256 n=1 Tax=Cacopsylla melanoneura TaxID=428564 RepID=A0A8D9A9V3_9HEMI
MTKPSDIKSCIPCYTGNSMFIPKCELFQHNQTDHPAEHFICDLCKMTFVTKNNLRLHIQSVHGETCGRKPKKMRSCPYCPVTFPGKKNSKKLYHQHIREVHNEFITENGNNTFALCTCDVCGKLFKSKYTWRNHMGIHSKEKPFYCEVCGKSFKLNKYLIRHKRYVHDKNPYRNRDPTEIQTSEEICGNCGKSFPHKKSLIGHMAFCSRYLNIKPEINTESRKSYKPKNLEGPPFVCDICNKQFPKIAGLNQHKKRHDNHEEIIKYYRNYNKKRPLEICPICGQLVKCVTFHMKKHTEPFECNQCGKFFARKDVLQGHMRVHTGERPFMCPVCGKRFTQMGDLGRHKKNVHKVLNK